MGTAIKHPLQDRVIAYGNSGCQRVKAALIDQLPVMNHFVLCLWTMSMCRWCEPTFVWCWIRCRRTRTSAVTRNVWGARNRGRSTMRRCWVKRSWVRKKIFWNKDSPTGPNVTSISLSRPTRSMAATTSRASLRRWRGNHRRRWDQGLNVIGIRCDDVLLMMLSVYWLWWCAIDDVVCVLAAHMTGMKGDLLLAMPIMRIYF